MIRHNEIHIQCKNPECIQSLIFDDSNLAKTDTWQDQKCKCGTRNMIKLVKNYNK